MPFNPPPQDHYGPGANFTRTHDEQEAFQSFDRNGKRGGIMSRWWPSSTSEVAARPASIRNNDDFDDRNNDSFDGAQRNIDSVKSWWGGGKGGNDDAAIDWRRHNNQTAVRDFKKGPLEGSHPNANVDDADVGTGIRATFDNTKEDMGDKLHTVQDKIGDAIDYGKHGLSSLKDRAMDMVGLHNDDNLASQNQLGRAGGISSDEFQQGQQYKKGGLAYSAWRGPSQSDMRLYRNSGYCSTQLNGYEQCLSSHKDDAGQCKGQWEKFVECQEQIPKSSI